MADDDRDQEEIDREAVMARRSKLVAVALASLTALAGGAACGPTACLGAPAPDGGPDAGRDGGPDGGGDGGPDPDAGDDAGGGVDGGGRADAGVDAGFPMPCLSMVPPDSGTK